ncbi:hypothetical protein EYR40_007120 [Pleurotus pulmonarius]|nr:hypothetical protein EYR40_007120 [Pleurotus pulmonarius]
MGFDLGAPANTALFLYILYSFQRILLPSSSPPKSVPNEFKAGYSWMPKAHPPTVLFKTYTPKTLEPFNGLDGGRILLAIDGTVFDVTAGRNFYGPNGMYGNFAGRDASRGMAKQSFDVEMLTPIDQPLDKLQDLAKDEMSVSPRTLCLDELLIVMPQGGLSISPASTSYVGSSLRTMRERDEWPRHVSYLLRAVTPHSYAVNELHATEVSVCSFLLHISDMLKYRSYPILCMRV